MIGSAAKRLVVVRNHPLTCLSRVMELLYFAYMDLLCIYHYSPRTPVPRCGSGLVRAVFVISVWIMQYPLSPPWWKHNRFLIQRTPLKTAVFWSTLICISLWIETIVMIQFSTKWRHTIRGRLCHVLSRHCYQFEVKLTEPNAGQDQCKWSVKTQA